MDQGQRQWAIFEEIQGMMKPQVLALAGVLLCSATRGQITLIGTGQYAYWSSVTTLPLAGVKWQGSNTTNDSVWILNPDMSLYRQIVLPMSPGFHYDIPRYITEDLFDTDPTTIEFATIRINDQGGPLDVQVYREDGTLLFSTPGLLLGWGLTDPSGGFLTDENGTLMSVTSNDGSSKSVFHLPGKMPCVDCQGMATMAAGGAYMPDTSGFDFFPNPSTGATTLRYGLSSSTSLADLCIFDGLGSEVMRLRLKGTHGSEQLDTGNLAPGGYTCRLLADGLPVGAQRLLMVR